MTAMDSRPLFLKVIKLFLILRFLFFIRTLAPREVYQSVNDSGRLVTLQV